ncbi:18453_t:CDS:2, partial [Entrophospora sp. SA101]
ELYGLEAVNTLNGSLTLNQNSVQWFYGLKWDFDYDYILLFNPYWH